MKSCGKGRDEELERGEKEGAKTRKGGRGES
jgi:hypothetical protein